MFAYGNTFHNYTVLDLRYYDFIGKGSTFSVFRKKQSNFVVKIPHDIVDRLVDKLAEIPRLVPHSFIANNLALALEYSSRITVLPIESEFRSTFEHSFVSTSEVANVSLLLNTACFSFFPATQLIIQATQSFVLPVLFQEFVSSRSDAVSLYSGPLNSRISFDDFRHVICQFFYLEDSYTFSSRIFQSRSLYSLLDRLPHSLDLYLALSTFVDKLILLYRNTGQLLDLYSNGNVLFFRHRDHPLFLDSIPPSSLLTYTTRFDLEYDYLLFHHDLLLKHLYFFRFFIVQIVFINYLAYRLGCSNRIPAPDKRLLDSDLSVLYRELCAQPVSPLRADFKV